MSNSYKFETIDVTRPRVRYDGRALDKCALSSLIHEVAFAAGNSAWPLWSDIYWDTATYSELKQKLISWLDAYNKK